MPAAEDERAGTIERLEHRDRMPRPEPHRERESDQQQEERGETGPGDPARHRHRHAQPVGDRRRVPAQPETEHAPQHDGADLARRRRGEEDDERGQHRDAGPLAIGTEGARHPPHRLGDDGDRDHLEPVERPQAGGARDGAGAEGEERERDGRGQR